MADEEQTTEGGVRCPDRRRVGTPAVPGRRPSRRLAEDSGMTTAEYAVGTVAACGFAGVLFKLLTSGAVVSLLGDIVKRALSMGL